MLNIAKGIYVQGIAPLVVGIFRYLHTAGQSGAARLVSFVIAYHISLATLQLLVDSTDIV